ncbi:MAG: phosphopyruvate hydratase [Phycisphaeraceae bacterium]|nr:phosphopyruvate hydratase [Phycisphaeraceae bacterium]
MNHTQIQSIDAWQIYDSRGNPTVEVRVVLAGGAAGHGLVPSGASTGQFEALELRDRDPQCFGGKSVYKAIANVRQVLGPQLVGMDALDQAAIDRRMIELDGTDNKSNLGANAILGISMAVAAAAADARGVPLFASLGEGTLLPLPEIQIIGGGAHANHRIDVQDFLVIAVGAQDYEQVMRMTHDVYHAAGKIMRRLDGNVGLADEGGYWPSFDRNDQAFDVVMQAIEAAGYHPGKDLAISLDIAASNLYDQQTGTYHFKLENKVFDSQQFTDLICDWCRRYPVISVEDPVSDTDIAGWQRVHRELAGRVQIVGDDLFTTSVPRIRHGIENNLANSVLIKLNQIGTVSETIDAIRLTQQAGWLPLISARSGETEDAFITHLAVATNAGQLKVGSFARSERMVKWNEVLRIQHALGNRAHFIGRRIYDGILKQT